jgi:hypothetical protein
MHIAAARPQMALGYSRRDMDEGSSRPAAHRLAGALLFLCGRAAVDTTGAIIPLDGGMSSDTIANLWLD